MPRDIEPAVNDVDNAYLYNVDDLQSVVDANVKERRKEAEKAEREGELGKVAETRYGTLAELEKALTGIPVEEYARRADVPLADVERVARRPRARLLVFGGSGQAGASLIAANSARNLGWALAISGEWYAPESRAE